MSSVCGPRGLRATTQFCCQSVERRSQGQRSLIYKHRLRTGLGLRIAVCRRLRSMRRLDGSSRRHHDFEENDKWRCLRERRGKEKKIPMGSRVTGAADAAGFPAARTVDGNAGCQGKLLPVHTRGPPASCPNRGFRGFWPPHEARSSSNGIRSHGRSDPCAPLHFPVIHLTSGH